MAAAPLCTFALALAALIASLTAWGPSLEYTRAQVTAEPWRAITAHFTHWSSTHLVWDWLAFVALGAALERLGRARLAAVLAATAVAIPTALLVFEPEFTHYRGLSGLDSALFGMAWIIALRHARNAARENAALSAALLSIGFFFAMKLGWELLLGDAFFMPDDAGFEPVPIAHAVGAALGVLFGALPSVGPNSSTESSIPLPWPRASKRSTHGPLIAIMQKRECS